MSIGLVIAFCLFAAFVVLLSMYLDSDDVNQAYKAAVPYEVEMLLLLGVYVYLAPGLV